jgi:hypothetical protein
LADVQVIEGIIVPRERHCCLVESLNFSRFEGLSLCMQFSRCDEENR